MKKERKPISKFWLITGIISGFLLLVVLVLFLIYPHDAMDKFDLDSWCGGIEIRKYKGKETEVIIPDTLIGKVYVRGWLGGYFTKITSIESLPYPRDVIAINRGFAGNKSVTKVHLPESLIFIRGFSFSRCSSLTEINIPESVREIGQSAFYGCSSLKKIRIPQNVAKINILSFANCSDLEKIIVDPANSKYTSLDGVLYSKDMTELIACPGAIKGSFVIASTVTVIKKGAFAECNFLEDVKIPDSVINIECYTFMWCKSLKKVFIGRNVSKISNHGVFADCPKLEAIIVDSANSKFSSVDGVLYSKNMSELISCPDAKNGVFVIPDSVTTINEDAFGECISLREITIPESVAKVGQGAFRGCSSLSEITIPAGVVKLGKKSFKDCSSLKAIYFEGDAPELGKDAFNNCPATIYYRRGTWGWGKMFGGRPTKEWDGKTKDASMGGAK